MMKRLGNIEKQIEDGDFSNAYIALDEVLSMGPSNIQALKLKALLLSYEGKFSDEAQVWRKVLSIDAEDKEAIDYFNRTMIEQREHEYFSDLLPSGGVRFLASPRAVVNTSFIGVMGCAVFLTLTNFSHRYAFLAKATFSYIAFGMFVVLPWLLIIYVYFRALRDITIDRESIHLRTRTSDYEIRWQDLSNFYLARRNTKQNSTLYVLLLPKAPEKAPILLKIGGGSSVVRAPSFLVREITRAFHEPVYENLNNLKLPRKPTVFS